MKFHDGADSDAILSDPTQIQQILMNLATNAAFAMGEKGGLLDMGLFNVRINKSSPLPDPEMAPGDYVKLTVRDTGNGMTERTRARIFEPFFTTKPEGQGTGMGLAVVYGIVKNHGGSITVESEPGKGSIFTVYLPKARDEGKQDQSEDRGLPGGNERILLVDDEPLVVEMTSQALRRLGYGVTTARSGFEALQMFLQKPEGFDLLMTDQTMPGITGIDLAERLLEKRRDLPVILFTGYSETVSPERARAIGIREFIMKPMIKQEMARTVRRALDNQSERGAPPTG